MYTLQERYLIHDYHYTYNILVKDTKVLRLYTQAVISEKIKYMFYHYCLFMFTGEYTAVCTYRKGTVHNKMMPM